jgi:hypothetical protein
VVGWAVGRHLGQSAGGRHNIIPLPPRSRPIALRCAPADSVLPTTSGDWSGIRTQNSQRVFIVLLTVLTAHWHDTDSSETQTADFVAERSAKHARISTEYLTCKHRPLPR